MEFSSLYLSRLLLSGTIYGNGLEADYICTINGGGGFCPHKI
jgi:hypothetical protein